MTAPSTSWSSVAFGNGTFAAVSFDGEAMYWDSDAGWAYGTITWPAGSPQNVQFSSWSAVAYGANTFVAVAEYGKYRVMTSTDGRNWTVLNQSGGIMEGNDWNAITYGNTASGSGLFVAVAVGGVGDYTVARIMTSPDGLTWTPQLQDESSDNVGTNQPLYGITNGIVNGVSKFVAVATVNTGTVGIPAIVSSGNGADWVVERRTSNESSSEYWKRIAYGGGLFVAVADYGVGDQPRVITSTDATSWTYCSLPSDIETSNWLSITYGNGIFVAVSDSGSNRVMYGTPNSQTTCGIDWVSGATPEQNSWRSVAFGNNTFVAVSPGGTNPVMIFEYTQPENPETGPEQNQAPAPVVTTTIPPTTTTTASKVKALSDLPETGSSNSLFAIAAVTLALGGAVTIARKRLLN